MSETEKPRRKAGSTCPLNGKDVSEVCHNCEWYDCIPVGRTDQHGKVHDVHEQWGCAVPHLLRVFRDWGAILDGIQAATDKRGNGLAARLDVIAEDMMTVSEVSKESARRAGIHVNGITQAAQRRVGGARLMIEKEDKS